MLAFGGSLAFLTTRTLSLKNRSKQKGVRSCISHSHFMMEEDVKAFKDSVVGQFVSDYPLLSTAGGPAKVSDS